MEGSGCTFQRPQATKAAIKRRVTLRVRLACSARATWKTIAPTMLTTRPSAAHDVRSGRFFRRPGRTSPAAAASSAMAMSAETVGGNSYSHWANSGKPGGGDNFLIPSSRKDTPKKICAIQSAIFNVNQPPIRRPLCGRRRQHRRSFCAAC